MLLFSNSPETNYLLAWSVLISSNWVRWWASRYSIVVVVPMSSAQSNTFVTVSVSDILLMGQLFSWWQTHYLWELLNWGVMDCKWGSPLGQSCCGPALLPGAIGNLLLDVLVPQQPQSVLLATHWPAKDKPIEQYIQCWLMNNSDGPPGKRTSLLQLHLHQELWAWESQRGHTYQSNSNSNNKDSSNNPEKNKRTTRRTTTTTATANSQQQQ